MENKIFILNDLENLDKLSCHTYDPAVLKLLNKLKSKGIKLSDLKKQIISGPMGFHLHTYDYIPENYPERVKLLQISNIDEFGEIANTRRDKYISKEKHEKLKMSKVIKDDLIVAKTGGLGRIALFNGDYEANLNQALGIIRLKKEYDGIKIIPEFIHLYLNSHYATEQFMRLGGYRAGQSGLSLDEIGLTYIVLPNENKQKDIIKKVNLIRKEAIRHYKKYLEYSKESTILPLKLLKITVPNENERIFVCDGKIDNRVDAIFNSPFLNKLKENIKNSNYKKLSNLLVGAKNKFKYDSFYKLIDLDDIDEKIGQIKAFKEVGFLNSTKTMFKKDNLLISKLGAEKGNIILIDEKFDGCVGSGELVPFALRNDCSVSLKYIFLVLRSVYGHKQIEYSLSGCSRMRISKLEMNNLLIPLPKNKNEESEIIKKINNVLNKSKEELQNYENKKQEMYKILEKEIEKEF